MAEHDILLPRVTGPAPQVSTRHPLRSASAHKKLMNYILPRLDQASTFRDAQMGRFKHIDQEVSAWFQPENPEHQKAHDVRRQTGEVIPLQFKLPLIKTYLEDTLAFLMEIFAPNSGMFHSAGKQEEQEAGNQLIAKLNFDAQFTGYYDALLQASWTALKYNQAAIRTEWSQMRGPTFVAAQNSTIIDTPEVREDSLLWEGNRIQNIDPYNLLRQPGIPLHEVHRRSEYVGEARRVSAFELIRGAHEGRYFNVDRILPVGEDGRLQTVSGEGASYYRHPPTQSAIRPSLHEGGGGGVIGWNQILGGHGSHLANDEGTVELVDLFIWLNPFQFLLRPRTDRTERDKLELWQLTIADGRELVQASRVESAHQWMPINAGYMQGDSMEESQLTPSETILPFQDFASYLMNTHVKATTEAVHGTVLYNADVIDMKAIPSGSVARNIPFKPGGVDVDINKIFLRVPSQTRDTQALLQDSQQMMALLERLFPTQALPSQVAGIDRAIDSQVTSVMQGANRRTHMTAKRFDESLLRPMRLMMFFNVQQFATAISMPDGTELDPADFRELHPQFIIGQGIKSIERDVLLRKFRDIVFAVLQNQQAAQQFDVPRLLDFWSDLADVDVDLSQFRAQPQAQPQQGVDPNAPTSDPATAGVPPAQPTGLGAGN